MTSSSNFSTCQKGPIVVLALKRTETRLCTQQLFNIDADDTEEFLMHRNIDTGERMLLLKERQHHSSESSMSVDDLPDYEDLYPDGGTDIRSNKSQPQPGPSCSKHSLQSQIPKQTIGRGSEPSNQHMKRLKLGSNDYSECRSAMETNSCSSSFDESTTYSRNIDLIEIPWESRIAPALHHFYLRNAFCCIVVFDVDAICDEQCVNDELKRMLLSLEEYTKFIKQPNIVPIGISHGSQETELVERLESATYILQESLCENGLEYISADGIILLRDAKTIELKSRIYKNNVNVSSKQYMMNCILEQVRNECVVTIHQETFKKECRNRDETMTDYEMEKFLSQESQNMTITAGNADNQYLILLKPESVINSYVAMCDVYPHLTIKGSELIGELNKCRYTKFISDRRKQNHDVKFLIKALEEMGLLVNTTKYNDKSDKDRQLHQMEFVITLKISEDANLLSNIDVPYTTLPVFRLTLTDRSIPEYVFSKVLTECAKRWQPTKQGQKVLLLKSSAAFDIKHDADRLLLSRDKQHIYVTLIRYGDQRKPIRCTECDTIRDTIEKSVCNSYGSGSYEFESHIRCTQTKGLLDGEDGWLDIKDLRDAKNGELSCSNHSDRYNPHSVKTQEILNIWFSNQTMAGTQVMASTVTKEKSHAFREKSEDLTDDVLAKVANCFGKSWELFFAEQKISVVKVQQLKQDNLGNVMGSLYETLRVWRDKRRDRGEATLSFLRSELKTCQSVSVDLEELDRIAAE